VVWHCLSWDFDTLCRRFVQQLSFYVEVCGSRCCGREVIQYRIFLLVVPIQGLPESKVYIAGKRYDIVLGSVSVVDMRVPSWGITR